VQVLLDRGARIEPTNKKGETALDIAREHEIWNVVQILEKRRPPQQSKLYCAPTFTTTEPDWETRFEKACSRLSRTTPTFL